VDNLAWVVVISLSILMGSGLLVGLILVVRDTVRKRGRWGINLRRVSCPHCGLPSPTIRKPQNRRQAMWGGCTCTGCGEEYDKWGYPVAQENRKEV